MKTRFAILTLSALLSAFLSAAHAANQTVSDLGDSGLSNQLRQKITDCLNSGGGTITFAQGLSGQITLTKAKGPLPTITGNAGIQVTIDGGGLIEISGNNSTNDGIRIFNVTAGATLTLRNLTLSHAFADADGGAVASTGGLNAVNVKFFSNVVTASWSGSAILCWGPLTITNCEFGFNSGGGGAVKPRSSGAVTTISGSNFHDNTSTANAGGGYGGAMQLHDAPSVTVSRCTFTNNSAGEEGGAIFVNQNSALAVNSTTFTGNNGGAVGGAIGAEGTINVTKCAFNTNYAFAGGGAITAGGSLAVDNTTFTGNTVSGAPDFTSTGGAIYNGGTTSLTDVTLSQNSAMQGGAINNNLGTVTLTRVTFAGNSAVLNGSIGGVGGGVANLGSNLGSLVVTNCTFSSNTAAKFGGGIYNGDFSTATLMNVTFSGNSAPAASGGNIKNENTVTMTNTILAQGGAGGNCSGTIAGSFNLADDNTCGFPGVNDIGLGPLASNGGFTRTHLPQPGSRAIDRGTDSGAPATDQRGIERPQLAGIDVGAVEVVPLKYESTDPLIRYDGWSGIGSGNANGGFFRWSNFTNDTMTYKFKGTSIKWITWKGTELGKAAVTIDGVSKGTFDLYRSATLWNYQILFGNLADAAHTIVIKVTGTKNANATDHFVPVDGFLVGSSTKVVQESALAVQYDKWVGKKQAAASGGSYRINSGPGRAEFVFNGTSVSLITALGPTYGKVNVFIDGQLLSSNLDLYAPTQLWQYSLGYAGLADASHILNIEPTHTKNPSSKGYGVVLDALEAYPHTGQ
jgi:predicted outer membrane repeat protein